MSKYKPKREVYSYGAASLNIRYKLFFAIGKVEEVENNASKYLISNGVK